MNNMKKMAIVLMIMLLSACQSSEKVNSDKEKLETVYLVKEADSLYADGEKYRSVFFEYNEYGQLLRKTETYYGKSVYAEDVYGVSYPYNCIYEYDTDGNIVYSLDEYSGNSEIHYYYENGLPVKIAYKHENLDDYEETYEYDENDNLIKVTRANEIITYEYDSDNRPLKQVYTPLKTAYPMKREISHKYDENGNESERTEYLQFEDSEPDWILTKYEYDSNNNQTAVIRYDNGEYSYTREYIYDVNNNLIKDRITGIYGGSEVSYQYDSDGNCIYREYDNEIWIYEYDDSLLLTETYINKENPQWNYSTAYEYDEKGNLVKWTGYDGHKTITGITEYSYDCLTLDTNKITYPSDQLIGTYVDEPDHPFAYGY